MFGCAIGRHVDASRGVGRTIHSRMFIIADGNKNNAST